MKINDLIEGFDAMTPAEEKKKEMLSNIMGAEEKKVVKVFDLKNVGAVAGVVAAVLVVVASVYNFGGVKIDENRDYLVQHKEESNVSDHGEKSSKDSSVGKTEIKPTRDKTKPKRGERVEVASAQKTAESRQDVPATVSEDIVASGGGGSAMMRRTIGEDAMPVEATEDNEVPEKDRTGISVVSEKDATDEIEWITISTMEGTSMLEGTSDIEGKTEPDEGAESEDAEEEEESEDNK